MNSLFTLSLYPPISPNLLYLLLFLDSEPYSFSFSPLSLSRPTPTTACLVADLSSPDLPKFVSSQNCLVLLLPAHRSTMHVFVFALRWAHQICAIKEEKKECVALQPSARRRMREELSSVFVSSISGGTAALRHHPSPSAGAALPSVSGSLVSGDSSWREWLGFARGS